MKNKYILLLLVSISFFLFNQDAFSSEQEDWDFANSLYVRKMYDLAQKEYKHFIKEYPNSTFINDAYYRIAESKWHMNKYDDALSFYQRLKRENIGSPKNEVVRLREALCYKNQKKEEKAISLLKEFEDAYPKSSMLPIVYYITAVINADLGNVENALEYYDKTINKNGTNVRIALYRKGHLLIRQQKNIDALETFNTLLGFSQHDAIEEDAMFKAGELYFKLYEFNKSFEQYKKFLNNYPDSQLIGDAYKNALYSLSELKNLTQMEQFYNSYKATEKYSKEKGFSLLIIAGTAFEKMDYDKSGYFLKQIQQDEFSPYYIRSIILQAKIAFARSEYEKVLAMLDRAEKKEVLKEELSDIYFLRAKALKKIGRISDAEGFFTRIISIDHESDVLMKTYFEKADCLYRQGNYEQASEVMKKFINKFKDVSYRENAFLKYAEYLSYSGDLQGAIEILKKFINENTYSTHSEDAYYRIGINYMKMNEYEKMSKTFKEYLEKFPEDSNYRPKALYWIGWNYLRDSNYESAIKPLNEIYEKSKKSEIYDDSVYWLAIAYYSLDDKVKALSYFTELLEKGKSKNFTRSILFWITEELIENEDYKHATSSLQILEEKVISFQEKQRIAFYAISIAFGKKDVDKIKVLCSDFFKKYPKSSLINEVKLFEIRSLILENMFKEALVKIESLAQTDNTDIMFRAFYQKAYLFEKKDQLDAAAREYLRLSILYDHPLSAEAAYKAYGLYKKIGDSDSMEKCKNEIITRWPESKEAKVLLSE
ncbi:MAG: tetratricopeptide repeat protein [Candidatus Aureabacteria bacterium]|nr:tetratricopeptide repeat protein [Candidatus Auribacterota bacterium]